MSGRDLQTFITSYRPDDAGKLTLRMKNGLSSTKYKPAEYERLQAIVDAKRLESDLIGQKVQKTRCAAKATKESSTLRQHRQVWSRECPRLQKAEETAECDIHGFLKQLRPLDRMDTAIFSLQDYGLDLQEEQEAFRVATVEPVHQLMDDLRFRLGETEHQQLITHQSNWDQVIQQINFVKDQQDSVIAKLNEEYLTLEEEIIGLSLEASLLFSSHSVPENVQFPPCFILTLWPKKLLLLCVIGANCRLQKYLMSASDNLPIVGKVPAEVLGADCPYPELKDSLIQAFNSLTEKYQNRLQGLQEQLQRADRFSDWCADDHQRFLFTLSQYTHDIPNHRALCMDMLHRLFPEKTTQELMKHERAWDWQRFTQDQLTVVTLQWQRAHDELVTRALVTLQEAKHAHQEELELHRDRQHQQDICSQLREKLQQWRAQQEEVAKLEAVIAARQQEDAEAWLKRELEKEMASRSKKKEKVRQFHLKQKERMETLEKRDQERLANLRRVMEEQASRDKERVQFRADLLQQRIEERALEHQRQEEEKQNRLEVLRKQIGVVAEADPERMMADTEAWKNRRVNAEQFELQKSLFTVNTYMDTQILSDPRVRVEQALREAGLHQSHYAKEVLSAINPPKPPRRDTKSLLKF
ncbi:uncharacterized protein V6R79_012258 [Siganus canaliculatus]